MATPLPTTSINGKTRYVDMRLLELRNVENPHDVIRFTSEHDLNVYKVWTEQLQLIVGKRVTRGEMEFDEPMDCWRPVLTFEDGHRMELLSDEEGNDGGPFAFLC
jgi:hypothetical protein